MTQNTQPTNKSFLSPIGFRFSMQRLPHVNYFCTAATIPDISLSEGGPVNNPFIQMPVPGDKLSFGTFTLNFRVDEDMKNFIEIYDWLIGLGYPDNFDQAKAFGRTKSDKGNIYSDGSMIITTAAMNPNIEIKFTDLYPTSLSSLEFNIEQTDVDYLQAQVTFNYRKYELTTIK